MSRKVFVFIFTTLAVCILCGCKKQLTLEEKAAQDAKEYNRRYCPTPYIHCIRTDSINFDAASHRFTYNCSFSGLLDNQEVVDYNKDKIVNTLTASIKESTTMKTYVESGYHFRYVCHSDSKPDVVLFEVAF